MSRNVHDSSHAPTIAAAGPELSVAAVGTGPSEQGSVHQVAIIPRNASVLLRRTEHVQQWHPEPVIL